MTTNLDIWWDQTLVATVTEARGRMTTRYTGASSPMLSISMPPRTRPYGEKQTRPFFHGLLPEGETRAKIAYDLGLGNDGGNDTDLLASIGRDCAGALVITPSSSGPPVTGPRRTEPLDDHRIEQLLRDLPDHPLGIHNEIRVSLPGVQNKLLLARSQSGTWHLPTEGTPSTHILKPESRAWSGSVDNELFCQAVAANAGVRAAATERARFGEQTVLISTRFDRSIDSNGLVTRLHQEDACQALSVLTVPLERKYQNDPSGLPSLKAAASLLDRWADRRAREALLDQVVLAVALGNADLHGKNLTFLHRGSGIELAPAYDLMSTTALSASVSTRMGMYVNGVSNVHAVDVDDILAEGRSWEMSQRTVDTRVSDLLERLPDAVDAAADQYPDLAPELVGHVGARVEALRERSVAGPLPRGPAALSGRRSGPSGRVRAYRRADGTQVRGHARRLGKPRTR